jgi:hypothetical protein
MGRVGEWANGRNGDAAMARHPLGRQGALLLGLYRGLKPWANLYCHFMADVLAPFRPSPTRCIDARQLFQLECVG